MSNSKLNRRDYFALGVLQMMANKQNAKGFTVSVDRRADEVYRVIRQKWNEKKIFLLTRNTTRRVSNMDISSLDAEALLLICNDGERCGVICEEPDGESRLSLAYAICKDHIVIDVFDGKRPASGEDAALLRAIIGTIVIMGNTIELVPDSSLEYVLHPEKLQAASFIDPIFRKELKRFIRERDRLGGDIPAEDKELRRKCPHIAKTLDLYNMKKNLLANALKMFVFVHCAEVSNAQYISDDRDMTQSFNGSNLAMDYYLVDSTWDQSIDVINPFKVSGHFKMQPFGEGRSLRKLIYVDDYMKHGYHRRAGKEIMEDNN